MATTQTLATADALLKDLYVGPIVEQLNQKSYMIDQIERDSDHIDFTGRRAVVPLHSRRNRGRGSISDGGQLPGAGKQSYLDAIIKVRENFQAISVTDGAVEASKSNEGAFVSILDAETKGAAVDMRKDMNRQVFGTGNGALATKVSATTGVKKTSKAKKLEFLDTNSLQYIKIGDIIDVLIESTGATTNGVVGAEVTEVSIANKEVTLSANLAAELAAETYQVYITGNRKNEMDGLRNITEEERTLHEVNSATAGNAFWNGQTLAVGKSLTETTTAGESAFEQLGDKVGAQGNGDVEVWLTSRGIRRRLADSYQSQKRWTNKEATEVAGGYKAIMVNDVPVIIDDQCPKGFVFGFNKSAFKWFELSPPQWLELPDGKIFQLQQGGTQGTWNAAYEAFFKWYVALGCVAPNRTGRLEFCSDDAPELSNS
jgi:hypothetical protein